MRVLHKYSNKSTSYVIYREGDFYFYRISTLNPWVITRTGIIDSRPFKSYKDAYLRASNRVRKILRRPEYATDQN